MQPRSLGWNDDSHRSGWLGLQRLGRHCIPSGKPKDFDPVAFLAQYFDTIEINSSFYGAPRPSAARKWAERVEANSRFRFTAKLAQAFTHKRNATAQDERDFKDGIAPLAEAGRFGALLLQFPWSFRFDARKSVLYSWICKAASANIHSCLKCVTQAGRYLRSWIYSPNSTSA